MSEVFTVITETREAEISVECVSVRVWKVPRLPSRQKYAKHAERRTDAERRAE